MRPRPGVTDDDVRCFLSGTVRALDLLLHEVFCLRASAVRVGGRAVLICGASAAGKSVLAAALAQRGHALLADQLAPVVPGPGTPVLWPTGNAAQLWPPPAVAHLGVGQHPAQLVRPALSKRSYRFGDHPSGEAVPVGMLVVLTVEQPIGAVASRELESGITRVRALATAQLHRLPAARVVPLAQFDWLAAMASETPTMLLSRPRGRWTVAELADEIERAAG